MILSGFGDLGIDSFHNFELEIIKVDFMNCKEYKKDNSLHISHETKKSECS